jgi:hypothetical protein
MRTWNTGGTPRVESCPSGAALPGVMFMTAEVIGLASGPGLIDPVTARPSHFMMTVRSRFCVPLP